MLVLVILWALVSSDSEMVCTETLGTVFAFERQEVYEQARCLRALTTDGQELGIALRTGIRWRHFRDERRDEEKKSSGRW